MGIKAQTPKSRFCKGFQPRTIGSDNDGRDGLALVEKDGKLMYIDHSGDVVWKER